MKKIFTFQNIQTHNLFTFICLMVLAFSSTALLFGCRKATVPEAVYKPDVVSEAVDVSEPDTSDVVTDSSPNAQDASETLTDADTSTQEVSDTQDATDSTYTTDNSDVPTPTEEPVTEIPDTEAQPFQLPSDPVLAKALSDIISYKKDNTVYTSAKEYVASLSSDDYITLNEIIANLTKGGFHYYGYYDPEDTPCNCIVVTEDGDMLGFIGRPAEYDGYYGSTYYLSMINDPQLESSGTEPINEEYKVPKTLVNGSWFDANADGIDERFLTAYYLTSRDSYEFYEDSFLLEFPGTDSKYIEWTGSKYAFSFIEPAFMDPVLVITPYEISCGGDGSKLYSISGDEFIYRGTFLDGHRNVHFHFYEDHMETKTTINTITTIYLDCVEYTLDDDGIFVPLLVDDYLSYYDGDFGVIGNEQIAMMDIPVYAAKEEGGDIAFTLKAGDSIEILGGNTVDWIKIRNKATEEEGWFNAVGSTIYLPDGTSIFSGDCFDNVGFYG